MSVKHCPAPDCPHLRNAGAPAEYRSHVTECADCGTKLVDGPAPTAGADEPSGGETPGLAGDGRIIAVARCVHPTDAQLVEGILGSAGVPYLISGGHANAVFGMATNVRVLVPEEHVERAKTLLDAEGLALEGEGPAYDEAEEQIEQAAVAHEKRTGFRPLVWFLLVFLGLALAAALKMLRDG